MNLKAIKAGKIFDAANMLFLIALCITILYPIYHMFIVSISDGHAVLRGDIKLWPVSPSWDTYKAVLKDPDILNSYKNTFLYTTTGTLINVTLTAFCAYPLARKKFYGRSFFAVLIIFTMFFEGGIIPEYIVIDALGLINTMWAIVLPPAIHVFYMIIMRTFFQQIPEEIYESAYIDGANDLRIFFRIILPLSVPVIATITLFYLVWHWNSFFPALMYLNEKSQYPMQLIMRNIVIAGNVAAQESAAASMNAMITGQNIKYAVIIVTIAPILVVYPFIQKYFVKGMMVGSLKG